MRIVLGFTGTIRGLTLRQKEALEEHIMACSVLHHGDCVGADAEAHALAELHGKRIVLHPPTNPKYRAFCQADEECEPRPYLDRNQDIVDACDFLVACPKRMNEEQRSGTWATVRRARKAGKLVVILWPEKSR